MDIDIHTFFKYSNRERERPFVCCFTTQMTIAATLGQTEPRGRKLHPGPPHGWSGPKSLHLLPPSQEHSRGAGSHAEQPGFELELGCGCLHHEQQLKVLPHGTSPRCELYLTCYKSLPTGVHRATSVYMVMKDVLLASRHP